MDMEASAVARTAERPAEVRMIGLSAEPEPRPLSASSTSIVINVVGSVVGVGGVVAGLSGRQGGNEVQARLTTDYLGLLIGSRAMVELSERQKYEGLARVSTSTKTRKCAHNSPVRPHREALHFARIFCGGFRYHDVIILNMGTWHVHNNLSR